MADRKAFRDGGTAFPTSDRGDGFTDAGMCLRDWLAGHVMAALYANQREDFCATTREDKAVEAYRAADAMLAAREASPAKETQP